MPKPLFSNNGIGKTAFSFRGYNVTNLGRTPELLAHRVYGAEVAKVLAVVGKIGSEVLGRRVDLVDRVRQKRDSADLTTYAEDVALIVAVELAQLRLLEQFFGLDFRQCRLTFGYSLGEIAALIATQVFAVEDLLPVPLALADDCVVLSTDVTMGVLFSRGPVLDFADVKSLCQQISQQGKGTIGVSSVLAPNSLLLLGQADTVDRFGAMMRRLLPEQTYLRKNPHRWPPLHTPITWQRSIPNRAAVLLEKVPGGFRAPGPPILSGVTGQASYDGLNSREHLHRWVDHPQQLWDMVYQTLAAGVDTVVHVGPGPVLIPATFHRLRNNVLSQLKETSWGRLGLQAVSHIVTRPWLDVLLASRTALWRGPFVEHIILEDWLLGRDLPRNRM